MKVAIPWIKHYLGKAVSDDKLVAALAQAGIEIEDYLPAQDINRKVVVGKVKKVAQHPNADKLRLAKVDTGEHIFDVVCGAPNLAEGQKVAFATVGSTLPGGEEIREAKLRGEVSQGMICSARELGLGDDHTGIIILPPTAKVGQPVAELLPAVAVVDIKTPFNRFDVLSVVGLAREAAAFSGAKLTFKEPAPLKPDGVAKLLPLADQRIVPRFVVAEIELGSHKELAGRAWLEASGTRLISPVVDVTNFVMWELGQPLHAYDADKVKGGLGVRFAKPGETLVTLDGVTRKLGREDLIIVDEAGPVGLAGVMGGQRTEVSASTKRILLEAATFDAATVRKAAKRHGLRSEASARFERGLPVQLAPVALARAAELIGGRVKGVTDELRVWPWTQRIGLRHSKLTRFLGSDISVEEAVGALNKLGIQSEKFDLIAEAKKHLGKPYKWGANFKQDGTSCFDCGYFLDYIFSLIGVMVGHTAPQIMDSGRPVKLSDLRPGDTLFRDGKWVNADPKERNNVSHVAMYIGDGKIIHAENYHRVNGEWEEMPAKDQMVRIDPVEVITEDPHFHEARRHLDDINDWISVPAVPWWRPDLKTEEDLIEEIARVVGYDRLPATLPAWRPSSLQFDRQTPRLWRLKDLLAGCGLFEVMTYSFISEDQIERHGSDPKHHLKVANPLSQEQAYLRRSPLPSLLAAAARNDRYARQFGMFEITRVFQPGSGRAELPREPQRLAILVKTADQAYARVKGVLDALEQAGAPSLRVKAEKSPEFLPGRSAVLLDGKRRVGQIGQLHPDLVERSGVSGEVGYLEIDLEAALPAAARQAVAVPKFPPVLRDLNLRLPVETTWAEVKEAIIQTGLAEPQFVNDYYPGGGEKNLAVRLVMTDPHQTLTDQEAEQRVREILVMLKKRLGAELAG